MIGFADKVLNAARQNKSWLCVGLDPDQSQLPKHLVQRYKSSSVIEFNRQIIQSTQDLVCAYKPNSAFYEALGPYGLEMLIETRKLIPDHIPMILDVKRGDIESTARKYAEAVFDVYQADAATLNPYLGLDSIEPFLTYKSKGLFILCRTSNPGAKDFQDVCIDGRPIYQVVAEQIGKWSRDGKTDRLGAVVGATYPEELKVVRRILGDQLFILVPGIGKQSGDLARAVRAGVNQEGERALINASRSVLYASPGEDFAEAARSEAKRLRDAINSTIGVPST